MTETSAEPEAVIVTGAASGIGLATVQSLSEIGKAVVGVDLADRPAELDTVDGLDWVRGDVSSENTWAQAVDAARRRNADGPSGLVSCAADIRATPFLDTTLDDWRRLFDVNVLGVLRGLHAVLPSMISRRRGAIAVVCSVNSLFAETRLSAYSTSKAALLQVVKSAALEHAKDGVRINAVLPGAVDTPMLRRDPNPRFTPEEAMSRMARRNPTGTVMQPSEIANALRFLLSADASGFSGSTVVVDGGLTTAYEFDCDLV